MCYAALRLSEMGDDFNRILQCWWCHTGIGIGLCDCDIVAAMGSLSSLHGPAVSRTSIAVLCRLWTSRCTCVAAVLFSHAVGQQPANRPRQHCSCSRKPLDRQHHQHRVRDHAAAGVAAAAAAAAAEAELQLPAQLQCPH
eukprot:SAG11_NODE_3327_length_2521_cov_20.966969_3_plen_140_part_00